jgi:hypothetical protein
LARSSTDTLDEEVLTQDSAALEAVPEGAFADGVIEREDGVGWESPSVDGLGSKLDVARARTLGARRLVCGPVASEDGARHLAIAANTAGRTE